MSEPERQNSLGRTSLFMGIVALSFVFSVGVCAGVGKEQGWLKAVETILFILGSSCSFLGLLGFVIGIVGLLGRPRGAALLGIVFGAASVWLFLAILKAATETP